MKMINAVLREPTRKKAYFAEARHAVPQVLGQGRGRSLGHVLDRKAARTPFEDDLKALREKTALSGNDFLPLVIKLDDMLTHLQSVSELVSAPVAPAQPAARRGSYHHRGAAGEKPKLQRAHGDSGVEATLQQLTRASPAKTTKKQLCSAPASIKVPEDYRARSRTSAFRRAQLHRARIEPPSARVTAGKTRQGSLRLSFQEADTGYKLIVEDDGQGLSTGRIKEAALKKGSLLPRRRRPWTRSRSSRCCSSPASPPSRRRPRMPDGGWA